MDEQIFKHDSTYPRIGLQVRGLDTNPTGKTATFHMRLRSEFDDIKLDDYVSGIAQITDVDEQDDSTYDFVVSYQWDLNDLSDIGDYYGEFEIDLGSDRILRLPINEHIPIKVIEDVE